MPFLDPGMTPLDPRRRVAREAARLLYTGAAEEYKQAKEMAARSLGFEAMPSNFDVALELDLLAGEMEGEGRRHLLIMMRGDALRVMKALKGSDPRLTGSVWRGTARRGSDIDIVVHAPRPGEIAERLSASGFAIEGVEEVGVSKRGMPRRSHHIAVGLDGYEAEVVVRPPGEEVGRCEIYGDLKRGLSLPELERLMRRDPLRRFVPRRRYR